MTLVLGIETSCDETAAAVVEDGRLVLSSVVSSQIDLHARFGGVVPEVASRAHVELITPVIAEALVEAGVELSDLDAVAACHGPGLAGALLVGVSAAKALALAADLPYVGVNHLEAHLHAAWLAEPDLEPPLAVLIVSRRAHHDHRDGGATAATACVGQTVDDAAGEAFDKVARHLGLGYPGGPVIDRLARDGDADRRALPAGDAGRGRLLVRGLEDRGRQPPPQAPRRAGRRRRRVVPGGGRRPAGRQAAGRGRRRRRAGARHRGRRGRQLPPPGQGGGGRRGHRAARVPAPPGALHRQRGDDRRHRLVAAPVPTAPPRSTPAPTRTSASAERAGNLSGRESSWYV